LIKQSALERKKVSEKRFDKSIIYMFRKRFNTILKLNNKVNSNIAEKLMAHKHGLDGTYLQPTREECFREFAKAIPFLTISDEERQRLELEKERQEKTELQKKIDEIEKLKELRKQDKDDLESFKEVMMDKISQRILKAMDDKSIKMDPDVQTGKREVNLVNYS